MGAWGAGYFDSDMSCDCWAELKHENTENALELIITYLQNVVNNNSYIEVDETDAAIVCSLLVIVLFTNYNWINESFTEKDIPKYVQEELEIFLNRYQKNWDENYKNKQIEIEIKISEQKEVVSIPKLANLSLKQVLNPKISESCELWVETEYYDEWKQRIQILVDKLEQIQTSQ